MWPLPGSRAARHRRWRSGPERLASPALSKALKTSSIRGTVCADELALEPDECAHIGDDLPDLAVIARCGLGATVPHAPELLQRRAHYVTRAAGGAGAVRELAELILEAQGKLRGLLQSYSDEPTLVPKPKLRRL